MAVLENSALRVTIDEATGVFDVVEKISGTEWSSDPWEKSAGELVLKHAGDSVVFDFKDAKVDVKTTGNNVAFLTFSNLTSAGQMADASVSIRLELAGDEPELKVVVENVAYDDSKFSFQSVMYPKRQCSLKSEIDEGYIALPMNQGTLIPSNRFHRPLREEWHQWDDLSWQVSGLAWGTEGAVANLDVYGWNALSMPWIGSVKNDSAFICVIETENDAQFNVIMNYNMQDDFSRNLQLSPWSRILVASPRFLAEKGKFGYERRMAYHFFPKGTHVEMAKHYRKVAERQGLLVTLKEKIDRNRNVEKLLGTPMINIDGGYPWYTDYKSMMFTWKDLRKVVDEIHDDLGVQRALICTWGGYAKLPPDSYPFHPEWGTEQELGDLVRHIQDDFGWLYTTYHGYPSNLFHAESHDFGESALGAGNKVGGRWGGRCAATYMKYARRDLPRILAVTGQQVDYSDIVSAGGLSECYHPDHGTTRTECRQVKRELFQYIRSLGLISGSEVIQGYVVPDLDYCKGGLHVGLRWFLLQHIHAPLYNLVFHDCIVAYDATVGTSRRSEWANNTLECMAYGLNPNFAFNMPHYEGAKRVIAETAPLYTPFLRKVGQDELMTHTYLGGGYDVQQTTFAGGQRVTINTDTAPWTTDDGLTIPPRGFIVEDEGKKWGASMDTHFVRVNGE